MKFLKTILIIIIILGVLAGGIVAIDYFTGIDIGIFDTAVLSENSYEVTEPYAKLVVNSMVSDIEIVASDTGTTKIETKNREGFDYEHGLDGETLRIVQKDNRKWYQKTGIFSKHNLLKVYVSKDFNGDVIIEGDSGDVTINGITARTLNVEGDSGDIKISTLIDIDSLDVENDTGDIKIENVSGEHVKVETETGEVTLNSICVSYLGAEADTGSIMLTSINATQNLIISTDTGDVDIKQACGENISIKTDTGDVTFQDLDGKDIRLEADTGDISGNILSPKLYEAHTSTGKVSVPRSEAVESRCYVRTHTGDITIR